MQGLAMPRLMVIAAEVTGCRIPSAENGAAIFRKSCVGGLVPHAGRKSSAQSLAGYIDREPKPGASGARRIIREGKQYMPPFRDRLSADEIDDVIADIRTIR